MTANIATLVNEHSEPDITADSPKRFINRELSWLAFNQRVVDEAMNEAHPIYARLRFLSISATNLEEFYMVRVAGLKGQLRAQVQSVSQDGLSVKQQLDAIYADAAKLIETQQDCWKGLQKLLPDAGIHLIKADAIGDEDNAWLEGYFTNDILPVLTPIAVDPSHPFPFIRNLGYSIAMQLYDPEMQRSLIGLVVIPAQLDGYIRLPDHGEKRGRFIHIFDLLIHFRQMLFPDFKMPGYGYFQVIRDSELGVDEEAEDLVSLFESALKRRQRGMVIRLTVNNSMPDSLLDYLKDQFGVSDEDTFRLKGVIGITAVSELIGNKPKHDFPPFNPRFPERIIEHDDDCFSAIREKDFVVHHPFESFDVVVQFLRQAARDPKVVAIKQTLYRTSKDSPIIKALREAAENGKSVTAMVELKARFDEAANIRWARDLERSGVQVVYGFIDLKTHAKVSLVTRREGHELVSYVHFGTGNYHPITAKVYTDLSFFTADPTLCKDAGILFNYMTSYTKPSLMKKLVAAPFNMRRKIIELTDKEIELAQSGKPANIWCKVNSLVDPKVIDKFYEASQQGVKINLVVRGICCLRPNIPGLSENIEVKSIVGRFLEHSRIYCFGNGKRMPSDEALVFISSADLMPRNLDHRVETMVPIENKTVHRQILEQIMVANMKDNCQSWKLESTGEYRRIKKPGPKLSAHNYFINNPSLSGRGKALRK